MDVATDRETAAVALGDAGVLIAILAWGLVDHHGVAGLLDPSRVVGTIAPFLGGFLFVAALARIYDPARRVEFAESLRSVAAAWFGGAGIGLVIRTSPLVEGGATWPFGLVATGSVLLGLLAWRSAVHLLATRHSQVDHAPGG